MQDEAGAKGLNPALERHWEKIVLAVVVVGFLIFLGAKFSGGGNTAAKGLKEAEGLVSKKKVAPNTALESPKTLAQVDRIPTPSPFNPPRLTPGTPTVYTPIFKEEGAKPKAVYFFPKVTLSSPTADFGGVEMEWTLSGTPDPEAKPPKPIELKPATYFFQIERRKKGEQAWTIIQKEAKGDPKTGAGAYRDEKTIPKTEYEYKVTLGSNDPSFGDKNTSRLSDKVGGPAYVTTPGMWKVEYNNITPPDPDAEPPKPGTAFVKITKYDPEVGEVSWTKIHKEGQLLGADETGNFVHNVPSAKKGKTVSVDFKMGGKLSKIVTEKVVPHFIQVCEPKPAPGGGGGMVCPGPVKTPASYKVNEVTYTDEDGKVQTWSRVTGSEPQPDRLCEDHGGAPAVRGPSPEEKSVKAAKLLEDADKLWNTNKRKEAQELYKQLLSTYGDTDAVKPRKNEIADRSTAKLN